MRRIEATRDVEASLRRWGFVHLAGIDEVGRGCLAGPVYAGAVVLSRNVTLWGLDDSKVLNIGSRLEDSLIGRDVVIRKDDQKPKAYRMMLGDSSTVSVI